MIALRARIRGDATTPSSIFKSLAIAESKLLCLPSLRECATGRRSFILCFAVEDMHGLLRHLGAPRIHRFVSRRDEDEINTESPQLNATITNTVDIL